MNLNASHESDPDKLDPGLPIDADEQLAQELNNPLARLISVPIQNNFDHGLGRDKNSLWIGLLLANQIWSLGGTPEGRSQINQAFVQAALAYTTPMRTTLFVSTESTYDYSAHRATVPLQLGANQLLRVAGVPFQLGGLVRYYVDTPPGGPTRGFQIRLTFVLPR